MRFASSPCRHGISVLGVLLILLAVPPAADAQRVVDGRATPRLVGTVSEALPRFDHLTIADGLSQNAVHAIEQDADGFLWFGTKDGLNRYDGYTFTVFRHVPFDSTSLSSSQIAALLDDRAGGLWVGTRDSGLNRFDRVHERARRFPTGPTFPITALAEDDRGTLWIGTNGGGLYALPRDQQRAPVPAFSRFTHDPADPLSLSSDVVNDVRIDHAGTVWVGTSAGLDRFDPTPRTGNGDLERMGRFVHSDLSLDVPSDSPPGVLALYEDSQQRLWAGTALGISTFQRDRQRFRHYLRAAYDHLPEQWLADHFLEAPSGDLWISVYSGLVRFDPEAETFDYLRHNPLDPESLSANTISALFRDRSDVMWLGTNGRGLNIHDPKTRHFRTVRPLNLRSSHRAGFSVYTLFEDRGGDLWIHAGVLYRWDRDTGRLYSFEASPARPDVFGNTGAWAMHQDADDTLWAGTSEGLYRYDPTTGSSRLYRHVQADSTSLPEPSVFGVYRSPDGALWAVTRNHLSRLTDVETGQFTSYRYTDLPVETAWVFPSPHVDADGIHWLASRRGLIRFDPTTETIRRFQHDPADSTSLSSNLVHALRPDPQRPEAHLWLGTAGGGLNRFDRATETFVHFTEADGLPNDVVYGIVPDDGQLWLSTNRGLARFNPETTSVRSYDVRDGLQSNEFNSGSALKGRDGTLFFGGLHGVNVFDPDAVEDNPSIPPVVLTGLRLSNRPVAVGAPDAALSSVLWKMEELTLSHAAGSITFEFAALDYSAPTKNRYRYRLDGFDASWVAAGTNRSATYTNLPPGSYTFRVQGSNNDGVWNEEGTTLALIVPPPWWRSWWAYGAYGLLFLLGVGAVDQFQRRRLIQQERERARLREAEIHAEVAEQQSDTLRRLDEMKSRFFANVSHEFRTPLTLTIGPLEDLRSGLYGDLSPRVDEQIDLALRNARRVLRLIRELLDLSKLEAGQLYLHLEPSDLTAVLRRTASMYEPLAERRQITFRLDLPDRPIRLAFDPTQLERVFSNLLSNAFKFTPEGGSIRLTAEDAPVAEDDSSSDSEVVVRIRDSGPGIPDDELDHIFERFYQIGNSQSHLQPGTGIGLALAWELVRLHEGTLEVESEPGFGSLFTVRLPRGLSSSLASVSDAAPEARDEQAVAPAAAPSNGDSRADEEPRPQDGDSASRPAVPVVLVVEDNAEMRAYIRSHLESTYQVCEAANGREGLDRARALSPDLIVSDVMMPEMDGYALCRAVKRDADLGSVPILLLTAKASVDDRLAGLSEGADDYLLKPFSIRELRARVDNLITSRRRLQEQFTSLPLQLHADDIDAPSADTVFLERVRSAIEAHLDDETFTVEALAREVGMSRVHLYRQLRALVQQSPSALIRTIRLERAAQLLLQNVGSVSEIAFGVGFKSVSHFSRSFREHFGCPPSEYAGQET